MRALDTNGPPLLNIFGGKITTCRKLAEAALDKLGVTGAWTAGAPLPCGSFLLDGVPALVAWLRKDYPFLDPGWARRLVRLYGTDARSLRGDAVARVDLGRNFGATLMEAALIWLRDKEVARSGDDVLGRRTKLGLSLSADDRAAVSEWFDNRLQEAAA